MGTHIVTINTRGLGNKHKRWQMFEWLKNLNSSIYLLQETHTTKQHDKVWKTEWKGELFLSGNKSNSLGVGILINPKSNITFKMCYEIVEGRLIAAEIENNNTPLIIVHVYGTNNDGDTIFKQLQTFITKNNDKNIIIGGDFNAVIQTQLDKKNGRNDTSSKCRKAINSIIESSDLCDIWRIKHPNKKQYTWFSSSKPPICCRLDYFLISTNLCNVIKSCNIYPGYKTDHNIVKIEINNNTEKKGAGYFKMNNSIILDEEYQKLIRKAIKDITNINSNCNPNTMWEIIKGEIRNQTIRYTTHKRKQENEREDFLINKITKIQENIYNNENNLTEELQNLQAELESIRDTKIKGQMLRSKVHQVEHNEKNTRYFANIEKRKAESKTIHTLRDNGKEITGTKNILNVETNFFKSIYEKNNNIDQDILSEFFGVESKKLNAEQKQKIEGKLSEEECLSALKQMQNNKSPGSDGISVEFYKMFWNDIKTYFIKSMNHSFEIGQLTQLQKQGIITLLPKENKDLLNISNWRPISLLNVDYKIATKAISNRIKTILPSVISATQSGFMKNRYIGDNVRTIIEVIEYLNERKTPGILLFADFEKAFDSLNHSFIVKCLQQANFGNDIIRWIKLFYTDIHSLIINNGHFSEPVKILRGVRQGCPLSSTIFIICLEVLSNFIENNDTIKGIKIGESELKQTLFADDATYFNNGEKSSFDKLVSCIINFQNISGLNLNTSKSIVFRVGSLNKTNVILHNGFKWTSECATTLGMTFYHKYSSTEQHNMNKKINEFREVLKRWQHRKLTLMGKVTVVKTFALPKLIYPLSVLKTPSQEAFNSINKMIFEFVWDGKPEKIKRNRLFSMYENGGLKLTDVSLFEKALKMSWIKRYLDPNEIGQWKKIYKNLLDKNGNELIFESEIREKDIENIVNKNSFLFDILRVWVQTKQKENIENNKRQHITKTVIWNNSEFKVNGKLIFHREWFEKGIKYIEHLFDFRTKTYYSFEQMKYLYNLNDNQYLRYYQLISCIPSSYKDQLKEIGNYINERNENELRKKLQNKKGVNKYVYGLYIKK